MSQHQVSPEMWISAYLHTGISSRLEIKKKTRSTKSRITDENRETILSVLFNDPTIFAYVRNTWSLRSLAKCLTEEFDIPINKFQTSSKDTERYGH
jgi:transposase